MIQPALPPTSLPAVLPVEGLLQSAAPGADVPDFAALLATTLPGAVAGEAALPPSASTPAMENASGEPAIVTAPTGNILPPALPDVAALSLSQQVEAGPAETNPAVTADSVPDPKLAHEPLLKPEHMQARRSGTIAVRKVAKAIGDEPETADEASKAQLKASERQTAPADPGAGTPAEQQPAANSIPPKTASPIMAQTELPETATAPATHGDSTRASTKAAVPATPEPAARALAQAAPQAAFLRAPAANSPEAANDLPAVQRRSERTEQVLRVEVAAPVAAEATGLAEARPVARRTAPAEAAVPMPAPVLGEASAAQQAPAVAPAPIAAISAPNEVARPHDFSALVDRLVAAREAVQPHAATLTVSHAEFGPVELRFRHEDRGLAVSLASADPDFARAAAAAPQPVMPTVASTAAQTAAQGETGYSAPQRDPSSSTAGSSSGQPRSQHGERRGEQSAHSNHSHRGQARPAGERRSGIFA